MVQDAQAFHQLLAASGCGHAEKQKPAAQHFSPHTTPGDTMPMSPCRASTGCRNTALVPVETSVWQICSSQGWEDSCWLPGSVHARPRARPGSQACRRLPPPKPAQQPHLLRDEPALADACEEHLAAARQAGLGADGCTECDSGWLWPQASSLLVICSSSRPAHQAAVPPPTCPSAQWHCSITHFAEGLYLRKIHMLEEVVQEPARPGSGSF